MKDIKITTKNPVDQILDENDNENVVLYGEDGKSIEFEQVAVIPLDSTDKLYAILIPLTSMEGVNEGEGVLFEIDEEKKDVKVVNDEKIIDEVLTIYQKLLDEDDEEGKK